MTKAKPEAPATELNSVARSNLRFPVVGLGASAGGLPALLQFFENTPAKPEMAFVVVMHLSPDYESNAHHILQKVTQMRVVQVNEPTPIEANHVFVIPPGMQLSMNDGYLRLSPQKAGRPRHIAVDIFLRTLGDAHREHAFGIVLSGTGSDGSTGLVRVKEQGGVTFAQQPEDAEYDSMPRSAIATGAVDFVLPAAAMPRKLVELWENVKRIDQPELMTTDTPMLGTEAADMGHTAEAALRDILITLRTRTGHDFKHYKRATVMRRIGRRMQVNRISELGEYFTYLQNTPDETHLLLDDMLIGVTNFFRDRDAFDALEQEVLPKLFDLLPASENSVRVWSAGSASGEEAYSVAMLLAEKMDQSTEPYLYQVFATDIDEHGIQHGRAGLYPEAIVADVSAERLRQHFVKEPAAYRIRKEIRERVLFAAHNLLRDPPFSRLHLVICRNLLIYLDRNVQAEILRMFHFALVPGGYLFLGSSESADACSELFTPVDKSNRIYRAKAVSSVSRPVSELPIASSRVSLTPHPTRSVSNQKVPFAQVHQQALEHYAPPSVLVNLRSEIVHMSDSAGQFLHYAGGEPSHNLLTLVHPELRLELRTALFQAIQRGKSVEARRVQLNRGSRTVYVNMVARPYSDAGKDYVLVIFDQVEDALSRETNARQDVDPDSVLAQLERELQSTKEQLQTTVEHSETSNEELKASNEELQAINEELRSTTEELETSKEELQSINEELITVNQELRSKVEETDKVNDDLQNLIASSDIATVFVDRLMRIKWYTPKATSVFSIIATDIGRSLLDITNRLMYPGMANDADAAFNALRTIEREVRGKDGRWYIARVLPYRTTENRIDGAVLTFIDVTQRREAENKLREGEERMRLVAESTRDYIIITMDDGARIRSWNHGAERVFGYSEKDVLGQPFDLIFTPEDRAAGVPATELETARREGRAEDERWHLRKDGSTFFCSGITTPLHERGWQGYAKIGRDVTSNKHSVSAQDDELAQSQDLAKLKDEFFAVMSHELKHPLNLIQLNAELVSRLSIVKTQAIAKRAVDTILTSVRSQARIIDDLLDLSRINTGKFKLNLEPVTLQVLVADIVDVLYAESTARDIAISFETPRVEVDPLVVNADPIRVEQVIWNLLNNALKFTPDGGAITLRLGRENADIRIDVQDTGHGIANSDLNKVFDMFGQVQSRQSKNASGGLGIGLALVKQLSEEHGGRVEVQSEGSGKGATFSIWLPASEETTPAPSATEATAQGRFADIQVLVVDDSPDIRDIMQALLEIEGAHVTLASDGVDALERCKDNDFDVILSDIGMPEMDGLMFMRALRQTPRHALTPTLALTGYGSDRDISETLQAGFNGHVDKPIAFDILLARVGELIGR
ncbi:CheR family methyltransferase [Pseudomonas matsuisoli]|uniref:Chemotaxis protein n=1 Tax=Pseudomonas matsuisoli TaxID=1515666 RepID=A0A917PUQ4_9PSED|nr:CheR family methyltransferase [Pseudomonas matsuisoli]GGJ92086.1 hypothetical protein GCM10009304_17350 [Pseudomonas matsuisoli]